MKKFSTVILVDDDKIINYINEKTIKLTGFAENIIAFDNATETISFMQENCHKLCSTPTPVVVFLDLNMPVIDGWEFLESVKKFPNYSTTACKIYILSSSIDPMDFEKAKEYEIVQDFISKPLTKEYLQELLQKSFVEDSV